MNKKINPYLYSRDFCVILFPQNHWELGGDCLNITTKGRYALRIMLDLAQHPDDGYISLKTIADRQGISVKYLEAIVGELKKADMVDSTRGKEGGYKLRRSAEEYSVGEILRNLEDNLAPVSCIKAGTIECDHGRGMHDVAAVEGTR